MSYDGPNPELRREDERSLWLNHALAAKLVLDPIGTLELAKQRLQSLRETHAHGRSDKYFDAWQVALDEGPHVVLGLMTVRSDWGQAMRSASPISGTGLLTNDERMAVLESFQAWWRTVPKVARPTKPEYDAWVRKSFPSEPSTP